MLGQLNPGLINPMTVLQFLVGLIATVPLPANPLPLGWDVAAYNGMQIITPTPTLPPFTLTAPVPTISPPPVTPPIELILGTLITQLFAVVQTLEGAANLSGAIQLTGNLADLIALNTLNVITTAGGVVGQTLTTAVDVAGTLVTDVGQLVDGTVNTVVPLVGGVVAEVGGLGGIAVSVPVASTVNLLGNLDILANTIITTAGTLSNAVPGDVTLLTQTAVTTLQDILASLVAALQPPVTTTFPPTAPLMPAVKTPLQTLQALLSPALLSPARHLSPLFDGSTIEAILGPLDLIIGDVEAGATGLLENVVKTVEDIFTLLPIPAVTRELAAEPIFSGAVIGNLLAPARDIVKASIDAETSILGSPQIAHPVQAMQPVFDFVRNPFGNDTPAVVQRARTLWRDVVAPLDVISG